MRRTLKRQVPARANLEQAAQSCGKEIQVPVGLLQETVKEGGSRAGKHQAVGRAVSFVAQGGAYQFALK
jgi:hypothetical protein